MKQQAAEGMPAIMCGDLAKEAAAAQDLAELNSEAYDFFLSCSLCDACTVFCPEHISCTELVKAGRERLLELQPELAQGYRAFFVDYRENLFTALKDAAGFIYDDALEGAAKHEIKDKAKDEDRVGLEEKTLFFAGCSLSSYSEDLSNATFALLQEQGVVDGMTTYCCGKPLGDIGLREAHEAYGKSLIELIKKQGYTRLIVACPNCFYELKALLEHPKDKNLVLEDLPAVLLTLGMSCKGDEFSSLAVHDSCPDRFSRRFAQNTRMLLRSEDSTLIEMKHHDRNTICCGAGGMAQVGGATHSAKRCLRVLEEFADTKAECLVSSCVSCVNAFVSSASQAPIARHYLEILTGVAIDWQLVQRAFDKVYQSNEEVFTLPPSKSTKVFDV